MNDFSGPNSIVAPAWATLSPTPQDGPMTKENKLVLLGLVLISAALFSLCF